MHRGILALTVVCAVAVWGCGGGSSSPTGPTTPTTPTPTPNPGPSPAGTIAVVNLDGGSPIANATVETLTGTPRSSVTDSNGHAAFNPALPVGTELRITAAGFITRHELSHKFTTFSLAPNRPGGFDLPFLDELVYRGFGIEENANVTNRINRDVAIVLPSDWQEDSGVVNAFRDAAAAITQANGRFTFSVETNPSNDKLRVLVKHNASLEPAGQATFSVNPARGIVDDAGIEIRSRTFAANRLIVGHEMMHVLGLGHINNRTSIMTPVVSVDIQPDDRLAMRFIAERNALNRYEDDGRSANANTLFTAPSRRVTFVCGR